MKSVEHILISPLMAAGIAISGPALAQEDAERFLGLDLARGLCSGCHVVEENQRRVMLDGVSSFPTLGSSGWTNA